MEYEGEVTYRIPKTHEGVFTQEQFDDLICTMAVFDCSPLELVEYIQNEGIVQKCVGIM